MDSLNKNSITKFLREKTGKKNNEIIKEFGISKAEFHKAIAGAGSRNTRLKIAKLAGFPPSMIWAENDEEKKLIDDLRYWSLSK